MMPKNIREKFIQSSGNVYADLGLAKPEERRAKAFLVRLIATEIERRGFSQIEAAQGVSAAQSHSFERLFEILHELGGEVSIVTHVGGKTEAIRMFS